MKSLIKKYVRLLTEIAFNPTNIPNSNSVALFKNSYYEAKMIKWVLYDSQFVLNTANDKSSVKFGKFIFESFLKENTKDWILATITIKEHYDDCNNANEVKFSAAQKGYGPLIYDIAMMHNNAGLFADRGSVSKRAQNIWDYYENNRTDVEKRVFNSDNPCNLHDRNQTLNASYHPKFDLDTSGFEYQHEQTSKMLGDIFNDSIDFEKILTKSATQFFSSI